jgi:transcriptional regulator with XRE-family HTH domain
MTKDKSLIKIALSFGKKLAVLRKKKGLSQDKLGQLVGVSQRVVAYYESETNYPPTHLLIPLAKALHISVDELLGLKETDIPQENHASLWRKLKKAEKLSHKDRKALVDYLNLLITRNEIKK